MRIFVYEFVTGGGFLSQPDEPIPHSLLAEGHAMLTAIAADFAALPDVRVATLVDHRLAALPWPAVERHRVESVAEDWKWFAHLAAECEATLLIAPEFARLLETRCRVATGVGARLLGPNAEFVALASDKTAMLAYLADAGVRVAQGIAWRGGSTWPERLAYPVVLKPNDGAGSQGIQVLAAPPTNSNLPATGDWRIETYHAGQAVSVALLAGPAGCQVLLPCQQRLSADGRLAYLGGRVRLDPELHARAERLATQLAHVLPDPRGYLGIDLVLGDDRSGHDDRVIELNPRLTTSYLGLRAACYDNLAAALEQTIRGQPQALRWRAPPVVFSASGDVTIDA